MANSPFLPSFIPSIFNKPASFFITFSFRHLEISTSLEMTTEAGCADVNLASLFGYLSSNNPDRSNPAEREMISKAFKYGGLADSCFASQATLLFSEGPEPFLPREAASLPSVSVLLCLGNPFLYQELSLISAMEILVLGFGSRILRSNLRASVGNQLGHLNSALSIFLYISIKFVS
ncbi:hypothetical protein NC653_041900 [Populus alba x Populus x berolinensis]|uniref:Uncharacterized protein n=1 Tax=Populus alba x Populus x berolinensis TaxID=444605 RepID=A0AAD6L9M5_9ROSI|nr:hypothetical protein NC653_041900 [Populus alba x Populus x berolinensis]